ncbi:unnamed protein product (macronuclear) [Paramecium tetraurelia]|uniref:Uncharacterized protein n=1 Tax=Paramecium tetraurelia TaxID=5888 RepID=A0ED13_PARTE|nr:uncharacterized protein GSPATT00004049001 [Paramecium tetraurelia]CAK93180.1 unnamed protein product [Paramecium tetraurelia]|eukprot:XP_001460577.1 hypothetical protein (macronuclear) [Paramecium tetraurelia strain d4-2]
MNQQFTDIINDELDPILGEFTSQTLASSSIITSPLKLIRQSNVIEIQNVHTKYKRVIQETIQKIILEIEKYYQQLIERNQAINFKLYQRIAEQTSNIQQLQDIVNQLTLDNMQFRNKQYEEEITQEFYDPQQYTIRQQKKELLELYDLNDQLSNKLKRQESVNSQWQDTIKRQNSQLLFYEKKITEQEQFISDLKIQISELQKQNTELQQQFNNISKQSQKCIDRLNQHEKNDIHSSKGKYSTLNQNETIETQQQSNKLTSQLKIINTTDHETATQPSQKCILQKRQKLILQSLEYQNCSDFEISVKNRQYYQNTIKKTELLDISDIIKPKFQKKPQILDDLYLYSNRQRNTTKIIQVQRKVDVTISFKLKEGSFFEEKQALYIRMMFY